VKCKRRTPGQVGTLLSRNLVGSLACVSYRRDPVPAVGALAGGELSEQQKKTSAEQVHWLSRSRSRKYNHKRPHSASGYRTPAKYAAKDQTLIATGQ
jgi:transposase InsO family protein